MAHTFHVYVPSDNLSVPNNTANSFRVVLPKVLKFNSQWLCGLSSIIYPYSYSAIGTSDRQYIKILHGIRPGEIRELIIPFPSGTYKTVMDLERRLNEIIAEAAKLRYDQIPIKEFEERSDII